MMVSSLLTTTSVFTLAASCASTAGNFRTRWGSGTSAFSRNWPVARVTVAHTVSSDFRFRNDLFASQFSWEFTNLLRVNRICGSVPCEWVNSLNHPLKTNFHWKPICCAVDVLSVLDELVRSASEWTYWFSADVFQRWTWALGEL